MRETCLEKKENEMRLNECISKISCNHLFLTTRSVQYSSIFSSSNVLFLKWKGRTVIIDNTNRSSSSRVAAKLNESTQELNNTFSLCCCLSISDENHYQKHGIDRTTAGKGSSLLIKNLFNSSTEGDLKGESILPSNDIFQSKRVACYVTTTTTQSGIIINDSLQVSLVKNK